MLALKSLLSFVLLSILLISCSSAPTDVATPSPMDLPTSTQEASPSPTVRPTETLTPSPSLSPTPARTATPSEIPATPTPTVAPGIVSGVVLLGISDFSPFQTTVELRKPGSFALLKKTSTHSDGSFALEGIPEGDYELWILLNSRPSLISGCSDVRPAGDNWLSGIKFGEGKAMTMKNSSMQLAVMLIGNIDSPTLIATGIYAVKEFTVKPDLGSYVEAVFVCS